MKDRCSVCCKNENVIKENKETISQCVHLDETVDFLKLLGNITRAKILLILLGKELCVCDIAESVGLSIPAISQQLKLLRLAGILKQKNEGKSVYYSFVSKDIEVRVRNILFEFN